MSGRIPLYCGSCQVPLVHFPAGTGNTVFESRASCRERTESRTVPEESSAGRKGKSSVPVCRSSERAV